MATTDCCVIYNPTAGRGRARARLRRLQRLLGGRVEFRATAGPGQGEDLAWKAAMEGFAVVGAAGGDGTVHEVANGLLRAARPEAALAVFPVGSANDYAYALGLDADWWLRPAAWTMRRRVDVGLARAGDGRQRYFLNGMGLGLNTAVTLEARRLPHLQGTMLYGAALVRALWSRYACPVMDVTIDSQLRRGPTLALTVAIGKREGSFLLAPGAEVDDGLFDYLHVGPVSRRRLLGYLPRMVTGRIPTDDPLVRTGRCREVRVQSDEALTAHCDGEFLCQAEDGQHVIEVRILPGALPVLGTGVVV